VVDGIKEKRNERYASRSWFEMIKSANTNSDSTSEIVAYHKVKRIFLNLIDMEKVDPNEILICEFRGQDFELIAD
jgi:hypothetical protein